MQWPNLTWLKRHLLPNNNSTETRQTVFAPAMFTPLYDFYSEEFHSFYVKGLLYTVRPDNDRLRIIAHKWVIQRRVDMVKPGVHVTGVGRVG